MQQYSQNILQHEIKSKTTSINVGRHLMTFDIPQVMGIVNVTPDSFYEASRVTIDKAIAERVHQMIADGATMIDIGACSTRPGALMPDADEEWRRLDSALSAIGNVDTVFSIDTFRADVARKCVEKYGVHIINDVSGGTDEMFATVAELGVAYVLTHNPYNSEDRLTGSSDGRYADITVDVTRWLGERVDVLYQLGVSDVIVDPGFGFGKTVEDSYAMMRNLSHIKHMIEAPLLVGISRKSMIWRPLGITPSEALNGTTVLNTMAIERGADILRVHDVREATETIALLGM